jgi:hypothetical protein
LVGKGVALLCIDRLEEALAVCDKTLQIKPSLQDAVYLKKVIIEKE